MTTKSQRIRFLNRILLIIFSLLFFNFSALAKDLTAQEKKIKSNIETLLQQYDVKVDTITNSPIEGLYQVTAGPLVLYTTKDGRYTMTGDVISMKEDKTNLTEQSRKEARVAVLEKMGEKNMIIFSPEKPTATVTVFTDIDCGYCRKLHAQIDKINDLGLKVRYLPFPRTGIDTPSYDKAVDVWCSKDKKEALTLAKQGKELEKIESCQHKQFIKDSFNFGLQTGVMGTPTFILSDGTLVPGYLPPEKLSELALKVKKS